MVTALQRLTYVVCAKLLAGHVAVGWELLEKQRTFRNHSEATIKGTFFGILSQMKKLSKSNDVHARNKMFLSSCNELILPLKIRFTEGDDITFIH